MDVETSTEGPEIDIGASEMPEVDLPDTEDEDD